MIISEVLEYYDQPYRLTLSFQSKNGQILTAKHIPDFFIIRTYCAGFEEWKPQEKLEKLAYKLPNRYIRTEDGHWHSPPAVAKAEQLGLYYRIRLDTEIDWIKYRNRQFLKAYNQPKSQISPEIVALVLDLVTTRPGITYWELLQNSHANSDVLNTLIAAQSVYVDLSAAPLAEPERVHIFCNQLQARAYAQLVESQTLALTAVATLAVQPGISTKAMEVFTTASPEALAEANRRYQVIEPYLNGNKRESESVPSRIWQFGH